MERNCSELLEQCCRYTDLLEERVERLKEQLRLRVNEDYGTLGAPRDQVFFCYSRDDRRWLEKLKVVLAPSVRSEKIDLWDDSLIKPGDLWREKIEKALGRTKVAVLLVSPAFLASEFIVTTELPSLLSAQESVGVRVLWIPIHGSLVERTPVSQFQSVIESSRPLSGLAANRRNEALVRIARAIIDAYNA